MQERGSALIVFGHAEERDGYFRHLRCLSLLQADTGQFSEIVFHARLRPLRPAAAGFTPLQVSAAHGAKL